MPFIFEFDSGGTAFNGVVEELKKVTTRVAHVLPVSDDGGSTAEIVRVLGRFLCFLQQNSLPLLLEKYFSVSACVKYAMMVSVGLPVLGGPAVGDIRSRCLRLSDESTAEALSVRKLLGHRLPIDPSEAKLEW